MADCNKIQANNLACNKISLTEQWKKGELPAGYYYIEAITGEKIIDFMPYNEKEFKIFPSHTSIVICEVPSYEEWKELIESEEKSHLQADSYYDKILDLKERNDSLNNRDINLCRIANGIRDENYKLKNIITEMCCQLVDDDNDMSFGLAEYFDQDLLVKIKECLK